MQGWRPGMQKYYKVCKKHGELSDTDVQEEKASWKENATYLRCRICRREKDMKWKQANRQKHIASSTKWKKENKEKYNAWMQEDRKKDPEKHKRWAKTTRDKAGSQRPLNESLRRRGLTFIEYEQMLIDQQGVCKLCHQSETRKSRNGEIARLCIDHCHETNVTRGLLCHSCNAGIGHFKDSPELLHAAVDYLMDFVTD
jgi:recombination endonuclease VII